jgi:hydroxyethylthiazole kinase
MTIYENLKKVREEKPLIHHLTNWVTIYDCANIVKVFGASPVMAHAPEEAADMAGLASALVLNIGTLTSDFIEAMKIAARAANIKNIPVVLDVCGTGATEFRDDKCLELFSSARIDIIKGNATEVARIAGEAVRTKGVDAGEVGCDLIKIAARLSKERDCVVVVTGKNDIASGQGSTYLVNNGCSLMAHVVGTGCMAASVIGTFAAVNADWAQAAANGLCCYEIAAQLAEKNSSGPGTFKEKLFDYAFSLDEKTIVKMQKVTIENN